MVECKGDIKKDILALVGNMRTVFYSIFTEKNIKKTRIVLLSDLHEKEIDGLADRVRELSPDIIALPGDMTSRLDCLEGEYAKTDKCTVSHRAALSLFSELARIAPTFYSFGNHELCGHYYRESFGLKVRPENYELIKKSGVVLLENSFAELGEIFQIGGLTSGMTSPDLAPRLDLLEKFPNPDKFSILLCHHPEYYPKYLKDKNIDLILSGHAHGGQIRLFGKGLFAPGQGVLPKYDGGAFDNRLVVGRGLANTAFVPRFFNPREIVCVDIERR